MNACTSATRLPAMSPAQLPPVFKKTIQIHSFLTDSRDAGLKGKWVPDYFIKDMSEIPAIVAALR